MSITAKELAQRLHLSAATVSMVLNRRPGISDETRDLVLSEAKRCGYDFSKIKTPPPGTVYLVVYKKHGEVVGDTPFFFQVIEGIETTISFHRRVLDNAVFCAGDATTDFIETQMGDVL